MFVNKHDEKRVCVYMSVYFSSYILQAIIRQEHISFFKSIHK